MNTSTDTPRTDACPHCGAEKNGHSIIHWQCHSQLNQRSALCIERELRQKAEAEVEELHRLMVGWRQRATMSETDLEASKAEVERLTEKLTTISFNLTSQKEY